LKNKEQLELYVNQLRSTLQEFEKRVDHEFLIEEWRYLLEHALDSLLSTREDEEKDISTLSIRTKKSLYVGTYHQELSMRFRYPD